ncbi:GNAT family N-acetyltransferase [Brevibacillus laterosporus]|nr:GNAT family N-acetyltransferase [Brevibacillus laterosporus]TPG68275.1 GNAT family N-acetyltransferase [Brevibacillus laterosporus]
MKNSEWIVRSANENDVEQVLRAICSLLTELRGDSEAPLPSSAQNVVHHLIDPTTQGAIFLAETATPERTCIGCITLSVQEAIHLGGRYALIQELWVHPEFRSAAIGAALVLAVEEYCRENNLKSLEVCLPKRNFITFEKTIGFYQKVGFNELGPRMRKGV